MVAFERIAVTPEQIMISSADGAGQGDRRRSFSGVGDDPTATVQAEAIDPATLSAIVETAICGHGMKCRQGGHSAGGCRFRIAKTLVGGTAMKPQQLELFEPSKLFQRGTRGQSLIDLADWTSNTVPADSRAPNGPFSTESQPPVGGQPERRRRDSSTSRIGKQQENTNVRDPQSLN